MGIEQICNSIKNLFLGGRKPFPQISRRLISCSMMNRPGLSAIQSTANVVKELNEVGIDTAPMPDGSMNLTVAFSNAIIKEIYRALKEDASLQVGVQPGSFMITTTGANAGGPVVSTGTNTNDGMGFGNIA